MHKIQEAGVQPDFFATGRLHEAQTLGEYVEGWSERVKRSLKGLDKNERKLLFYSRYNLERMQRLADTYKMADFLKKTVDSIMEDQIWMFITEDWCADSAYALPVISRISVVNPRVNIRILFRDENLDVMDRYLSDGKRSIPKLVVFGEDGAERFQWGSRPRRLTEDRVRWADEGIAGPAMSQRTIEWYEAGGWGEVEVELANAIEQIEPTF